MKKLLCLSVFLSVIFFNFACDEIGIQNSIPYISQETLDFKNESPLIIKTPDGKTIIILPNTNSSPKKNKKVRFSKRPLQEQAP